MRQDFSKGNSGPSSIPRLSNGPHLFSHFPEKTLFIYTLHTYEHGCEASKTLNTCGTQEAKTAKVVRIGGKSFLGKIVLPAWDASKMNDEWAGISYAFTDWALTYQFPIKNKIINRGFNSPTVTRQLMSLK